MADENDIQPSLLIRRSCFLVLSSSYYVIIKWLRAQTNIGVALQLQYCNRVWYYAQLTVCQYRRNRKL